MTLLVAIVGEVTDDKNVRVIRDTEVWCHHNATRTIKFDSSGRGENASERRRLHTSRPQYCSCWNMLALIIPANDNGIWLNVRYYCPCVNTNPQACQCRRG